MAQRRPLPNGIGDVLLAWENEAFLAVKEKGGEVRDRHPVAFHPGRAAGVGNRQDYRQARHAAVAEAYLEYLYSPVAQELQAAQLLSSA